MSIFFSWLRQNDKPRTLKLVLLVIAMNALTSLALMIFGVELGVISVIVFGAASGVTASMMLNDRATNIVHLTKTFEFMGNHIGSILCQIVLVCVSLWAFYNNAIQPEPEMVVVRDVKNFVDDIGLLVIMFVSVRYIISSSRPSFILWLERFILALSVYSLASYLIGKMGDYATNWIMANPESACAAVIVVLVLRLIWAAAIIPHTSQSMFRSGSIGTALLKARNKAAMTDRDRSYIAAHEAGHALVYAALDELPANLKMVINEHTDSFGTAGSITRAHSGHQIEESRFAEWEMLVLLAGRLGEITYHGQATLGCIHDHQRWLDLAHQFLSGHAMGIYYPEPKNKYEQEQNDIKKEALKIEQMALLNQFFDMNKALFKELSDTLLQRNSMDAHELKIFLEAVKLPDAFPKIYLANQG